MFIDPPARCVDFPNLSSPAFAAPTTRSVFAAKQFALRCLLLRDLF